MSPIYSSLELTCYKVHGGLGLSNRCNGCYGLSFCFTNMSDFLYVVFVPSFHPKFRSPVSTELKHHLETELLNSGAGISRKS